eukprot:1161517-Pelagomonas_calceolata.AAC.17
MAGWSTYLEEGKAVQDCPVAICHPLTAQKASVHGRMEHIPGGGQSPAGLPCASNSPCMAGWSTYLEEGKALQDCPVHAIPHA